MKNITWITGASSGIGKAVSKEFTANEIMVAGTSRRIEELERFKNSLGEFKDLFIPLALDVSDPEQIKTGLLELDSEDNIDCLINNAGVTTFTKAEVDDVKKIKEVIDTNLLGAIYSIKAVLPKMIDRKKGLIINILSVAAIKIFTKSSAYAASKAGLKAYIDVLREEVREYNIKIVNIFPGPTRTPIWPNDALEKFAERMMSPDDIAKLIYTVYSEKSTIVPEEIVLRPIKGDLD